MCHQRLIFDANNFRFRTIMSTLPYFNNVFCFKSPSSPGPQNKQKKKPLFCSDLTISLSDPCILNVAKGFACLVNGMAPCPPSSQILTKSSRCHSSKGGGDGCSKGKVAAPYCATTWSSTLPKCRRGSS